MSSFPLRAAILSLACTAAFGLTVPAQAARFHARTGAHYRHAGATWLNPAGGLTHVRGIKLSGDRGVIGHASKTTRSDGNVSHKGGTNVTGANGGTYKGTNSYTRSDGSVHAAHQASGTGPKGGTYDTTKSYTRDGNAYTVNKQSSATNAKGGSYQGSTSKANGTATHDTSLVNANGASYTGQTSYTKGQGITHSGTCTDANGNVIACPK